MTDTISIVDSELLLVWILQNNHKQLKKALKSQDYYGLLQPIYEQHLFDILNAIRVQNGGEPISYNDLVKERAVE